MTWDVVAETTLTKRQFFLIKYSLNIRVKDYREYDDFYPSVHITLYGSGLRTPSERLADNYYQPKSPYVDKEGTSVNLTQHVVQEALAEFRDEMVERIHELHMENSKQTTVQEHLDAAVTADTVDEIFALAERLDEAA